MRVPSSSPVVVAGRLVTHQHASTFPALTIRASARDPEQVLAEAVNTGRGEFSLLLPLVGGTAFELPIVMRAVDASGEVLGEARVTVRGERTEAVLLELSDAVLSAARPVREEGPLELLNEDSITMLKRKVMEWAKSGLLADDAPAVLDDALQPLRWAAQLMEDARGTMEGESDAAARLREALLGLGASSQPPETFEDTECECEPEETSDTETPDALLIIDPDAMALLAAATVRAAPDREEGQAMLNGLAAVLWPRPFVELLLHAAYHNQPAPMQPLMGGLPPGWGIPPGLLGPKVPGGKKGWDNVPKPKDKFGIARLFSKFSDLTPAFNAVPSKKEKCLISAMMEVEKIKKSTPQYEIRTISNPRACPGEIITLTGVNFGPFGVVVFTGKNAEVSATDVPLWSDTQIQVRVPQGATPGPIRLSILITSLFLCNRFWNVFRLGTTIPYFNGGVPAILLFLVDGKTANVIVEPDADMSIKLDTSVGEGVNVQLRVLRGAVSVFLQNYAGGSYSVTFHTPTVTAATDLVVRLRVSNHCGTSEESIAVIVARRPDLNILQAEVTQGVQRLDNTVRLAARRNTMVRVYLDSGLTGNFAYAAQPRSLPGVSGTVTMYRSGQVVGTVTPINAPYTVRSIFFPAARESVDGSLNFMLPWDQLTGPMQLQIKVWVDVPPHGVEQSMFTEDFRTINVNFEPCNGTSLVRVLIKDDWRTLAAPTAAEWQTSLLGARSRYPVPEDGWTILVHPSAPTITVNEDLTKEDAWNWVLEAIDDIAEDVEDGWDHHWAGLIAADRGNDKLKLNGVGRPGGGHDYPAFVAQAGLPTTFAHELTHTFGVNHSGCPTGPNAPKNVDATLPGTIEEPAIDVNTLATFQVNASGDLMSYCFEFERFPSIVLWHRLMDMFKK
jgi:hypothetical protein